jgi:hypothetical protein
MFNLMRDLSKPPNFLIYLKESLMMAYNFFSFLCSYPFSFPHIFGLFYTPFEIWTRDELLRLK